MASLDPNVVSEIVGRVSHTLREALSGIQSPGARRETPVALAEAAVTLRQGTSQSDVLRALLRAAPEFGARAALFVARPESLDGWEATGFEDEPALSGSIRGTHLSRDHSTIAALFEDEVPIHAEVGGAFAVPDFGQTVRGEAILIPLEVQTKIAAVLYADPAGGERGFDRHGLAALTEIAGMAIERLVLSRALGQARSGETGPQLQASGAHAVRPAAAAAPAAPAPPVPSPGPAVPSVDRVVPAAAPRPEIAWPGPAAGAGAGASGITGPPTGPAFGAFGGGQTTGSPEIEDARRYARLLMEEILLYHGDKVEEGRVRRDLRTRLADEIDKARQLYDRRVEARVRAQGEFFEEAMARVLGGGDPAALGA